MIDATFKSKYMQQEIDKLKANNNLFGVIVFYDMSACLYTRTPQDIARFADMQNCNAVAKDGQGRKMIKKYNKTSPRST